ncbi:TetR/AcrR family transcriptional regulator C-terminal domain-containing protein [Pseudonocardia aurantiaca]|uniref:TetR/AcrR family transcriptional regulator C-terminal domain-containing protein n=1 Tax=Pseudonocardia aurantiaca TaxID=75290 RepID=A0ABW4FXS5_9PSEU
MAEQTGRREAGPAAGPDGEPVSLWERLERPPVARTVLTHEQIAAAAIEIADADGLAAVTIRGLAARLDAAPMALYRYVKGKDEVFELMVDAVVGAEPDLPPAATWREAMRAQAHRTRDTTLAHRWLIQVPPQARAALTPRRFAAIERSLAALDGLGLDADHRMAVFDTVTAYATGAAATETTMLQLMEGAGWSSGHELRTALGPQMRWLMSTGRYPAYQRTLTESRHIDDASWRFELGLECVLDGIACRLGI